ncbi:hypothetical protein [Lunatibacter salilacus]|uniref:hypothetical protein n=1 Tax=Lunatibacter salilacus TaxID=2483804 RepID=UPI00131D7D38|nr:hypothetical protein [Lunatibacter salilacus]
MSIALGSIIIILLILPGMFFRSFVIKSESFENPLDTSFKAEVSIVFIYSILAHFVALGVISQSDYYTFNFKDFYLFFLGKGEELDAFIFDKSIFIFLTYLIGQSFLGGIVGVLFRSFIVCLNWDIRFIKFPITNEWDNILSGRFHKLNRIEEINQKITNLKKNGGEGSIEKIRDFKKARKIDPNQIIVTVLVDIGGKSIIYRGFLHKYYLASNNSLSKIILTSTRKITESAAIPLENTSGNMFIIPYKNIINLDVREVFLNEIKESGNDSLQREESIPFLFKFFGLIKTGIWIFRKYFK